MSGIAGLSPSDPPLSRPRRRRQLRRWLHRHAGSHPLDAQCRRQAIRRLNDAGYFVFLFTNQAGVARGFFSEDDVRILLDWMRAELAAQGARIDDVRYCPHHPEGSVAGYLEDHHCAQAEAGHDPRSHGTLAGEQCRQFRDRRSPSDIEAAQAADLPGFLFAGGDLDAFVSDVIRQTSVL